MIEKAKELHQSLDQPLVQLGRCQTQSGPKRVGFHTKGYKQLHQYSTCLPLPHMTCVELQELHSMHFLQYHSISHLHKLKYQSPIWRLKLTRAGFILGSSPESKPGFTQSESPKSMAFRGDFSSLEVKRKFWSRKYQIKVKKRENEAKENKYSQIRNCIYHIIKSITNFRPQKKFNNQQITRRCIYPEIKKINNAWMQLEKNHLSSELSVMQDVSRL